MTEDDTYEALKRIPFADAQTIFRKYLLHKNGEVSCRSVEFLNWFHEHTFWHYNDFVEEWLKRDDRR